MRTIPLTKGYEAIVDDEDFERFGHLKWHANVRIVAGREYVMAQRGGRSGEPGTVLLHREIVNAAPGVEVDHWDGNPLHNWRKNLRPCTRTQNLANTPSRTPAGQYRGVQKARGRWRAAIWVNNKMVYLGSYRDADTAAAAYNVAAVVTFGEFAILNDVAGL